MMKPSDRNDTAFSFAVSADEKRILRELGRRVAEIGHDPVNRERAALWNRLNRLERCRPLIYIWQRVANVPWGELDANGELSLRTHTPFAREVETELRQRIYRFTHLVDDSVFESKIYCTYEISDSGYGVEMKTEQSELRVNDISSRRFAKVSGPRNVSARWRLSSCRGGLRPPATTCFAFYPEWHLLKLLLGRGGKAIVEARMGHQREGFWAAFADAGFGAVGAKRDDIFGEDLKEVVEESGLFARLA
jgi:hypothetical protein